MLEAEIPDWLAEEARQNTTTLQEANEYVLDAAQDMDVMLSWPDES